MPSLTLSLLSLFHAATAVESSCQFECGYNRQLCTELTCAFLSYGERSACISECETRYQGCSTNCTLASERCAPSVHECLSDCAVNHRGFSGEENCIRRCELKNQCCSLEKHTINLGNMCGSTCGFVLEHCHLMCGRHLDPLAQQDCSLECDKVSAGCREECEHAHLNCSFVRNTCKENCSPPFKSQCQELCETHFACCETFPQRTEELASKHNETAAALKPEKSKAAAKPEKSKHKEPKAEKKPVAITDSTETAKDQQPEFAKQEETTSNSEEVLSKPKTTEAPVSAETTEAPKEKGKKAKTSKHSEKSTTKETTTVTTTEAPETEKPTKAPETEKSTTTKAPKTEKPTKAPKTEKPTKAPKTEKPTKAPKTEKPTKAPKTEKPTKVQKEEKPPKLADAADAITVIGAVHAFFTGIIF